MKSLFYMRTAEEFERYRRIKVSILAYAYEILNKPVAFDHEFDDLCQKIDLSIDTDRPDLDKWFREEFSPHTGMWIHKHPELEGIKKRHDQFYI